MAAAEVQRLVAPEARLGAGVREVRSPVAARAAQVLAQAAAPRDRTPVGVVEAVGAVVRVCPEAVARGRWLELPGRVAVAPAA